MATCSTHKFEDTSKQWDHACYDRQPYLRYCHIPALNGDSSDAHFSFTPYTYFTADTARKTCKKIGGKVPGLSKSYDSLWLSRAIAYLSSFVRFARPYSLRWATWPVRRLFLCLQLKINIIISLGGFTCIQFTKLNICTANF